MDTDKVSSVRPTGQCPDRIGRPVVEATEAVAPIGAEEIQARTDRSALEHQRILGMLVTIKGQRLTSDPLNQDTATE